MYMIISKLRGSKLYLSSFSFIIFSLDAAIFIAMMRFTSKENMQENRFQQNSGNNHYASKNTEERNKRSSIVNKPALKY